jgi:hypothetical protein
MKMMRLKVSFRKIPVSFLLICLSSIVCLSQIQQSVSSDKIVFEISTKEWGMSGDDCPQMLKFRLYASGRVEYDICQYKDSNTGRQASFLLRKELKLPENAVAEFVKFVEQSGFIDAWTKYYSGLNLVDIVVNSTIIYRNQSGEKKVEIMNYLPKSKNIPKFIDQIIEKADKFIPKQN